MSGRPTSVRSHPRPSIGAAVVRIVAIVLGAILILNSGLHNSGNSTCLVAAFTVFLYYMLHQSLPQGGGGGDEDGLMKKLKEVVDKKFPEALKKLEKTTPHEILSSLGLKNKSEHEVIDNLIDMVGKQTGGRRNATRRRRTNQ